LRLRLASTRRLWLFDSQVSALLASFGSGSSTAWLWLRTAQLRLRAAHLCAPQLRLRAAQLWLRAAQLWLRTAQLRLRTDYLPAARLRLRAAPASPSSNFGFAWLQLFGSNSASHGSKLFGSRRPNTASSLAWLRLRPLRLGTTFGGASATDGFGFSRLRLQLGFGFGIVRPWLRHRSSQGFDPPRLGFGPPGFGVAVWASPIRPKAPFCPRRRLRSYGPRRSDRRRPFGPRRERRHLAAHSASTGMHYAALQKC